MRNYKYQIISEPWRVDDGEDRVRDVPEEMALVLTSFLCNWRFSVIQAVHLKRERTKLNRILRLKDITYFILICTHCYLEASAVKSFPVVVLVAAHQDIGKTGFADSSCSLQTKSVLFIFLKKSFNKQSKVKINFSPKLVQVGS